MTRNQLEKTSMLDTFKTWSLTVYRNDEHKRAPTAEPMISLRADDGQNENGVSHIWFFLTWAEFQRLTTHAISIFADGYHKLETFGELWTFYDFDVANYRESAGIATVKYARVTVPDRVCTNLREIAALAVWQYDATPASKYGSKDRIVVDLTPHLAAWCDEYGQGKGSVRVDACDTTRERLQECRGADSNFLDMLDRILQIARNTTHARSDVATARISRDGNGFFWVVPGLHGGLINHGTEQEPDWSLHT